MDYPYIRAWGKILGWTDQYTEAVVELARQTRAPNDAFANTYKGGWHRLDEMTQESTRKQIIKIAEDVYGAPPRDT